MVLLIFGTTCALSELFKLFYPSARTTHIVRGWQTHHNFANFHSVAYLLGICIIPSSKFL